MTAFFEKLVNRIWETVDAENRSQSRAIFERLLDEATPVINPRRRNPFLGD
jgi:hypothetical protein